MAQLSADIRALKRKAARLGMIPVVRLNGTSDIPWENVKGTSGLSLMEVFPDVQFYDYTKNALRVLSGKLPRNYSLTFSRSECNGRDASRVLAAGGNVAVVFGTKKGAALPATWQGFPVVNGDVSDLRFTDPQGVVVGLYAKGKARKDTSGFVVMGSPEPNDGGLR